MAKRFSRQGKLVLVLSALIMVNVVLGIVLLARSCSSPAGQSVESSAVAADQFMGQDSVLYEEVIGVEDPFEEEQRAEQSASKGTTLRSGALQEPITGANYLEKLIFKNNGKFLYGLPITGCVIRSGEIESGQTFGKLLNDKFNVNIAVVNELVPMCEGVFDLRNIRVGNNYTAIISESDDPAVDPVLEYLIYEVNSSEYIIFATGQERFVKAGKKKVTVEECYSEGVIESSLYATIYKEGLSPMLAERLDEIFKWSIDFYSLRKGDRFRVLYEEHYIDTLRVGIGKIYGAEFIHQDMPYLAIRFEQGEELGYWDDKGKNLRKNFLQSPLKFSARVSSNFGSRIHPIRGYRKQHNGIDYAAPTGTRIYAVADGTVTARYWERGGGNVLKIKHAHGLETLYLHLSRFADVKVGQRVKQGDLIAYVGNTGQSTGPHLHYGVKKDGKYINPTKIPSTPTTPIKEESKARFETMKTDVMEVMDQYASKKK